MSSFLMKKSLFIIFFCLSFFFVSSTSAYAALMLSETQPGGNINRSWAASAISSNGQKIIVGNQDGGLYFSSNGGNNWAQINPSPYDSSVWYTAAMSGDGQVILVGTYGNRIYLTTNGGVSWSETQPKGDADANWISTSMSSDGRVMLAGVESGRLYLSTNSGVSWSETRPAGNVNTTSYTAVSSNGQTLLVGENEGSGGRLYLSTNSGASWSETRPAGDTDYGWRTVSMSPDGQVMLAGTGGGGGRLYLSTNAGNSWSETQPRGDSGADWILSSVSSGGQTMFVSMDDRLYFSTNAGNSWSEMQPNGDQNGNWQLLSMSGNSQVFVAGNYDGRIFLGSYPPVSGAGSPSDSPPCPTINGAPDLFQINTDTGSATVYFSPVGQATNYVISYGFSSDANQFAVMSGLGTSTGVLSYTINSLPLNTTTYFKIYGQNNCGQGNWSNTMSATTVNNGQYYKNIVAQVLSILPRQTTVLGAKTSKVLGAHAQCETYTVKSGDSLWGISSKKLGTGVLYKTIMETNNLQNTSLSPGRKLKVGC